jgi:23S rRNA pseudouridine2604 synthase
MTESVRLAKRLAETVPCSRREAELYIEGGWVQVDGQVVEEPGYRVLPQQSVALLPGATPEPLPPVSILMHQPADAGNDALHYLTPDNLVLEAHAGIRFLKRHLAGLSAPLPLEPGASGLQVWTQDWRVLRKLGEDASRIEQEYIVDVAGELAPNGLALLNHGLQLDGKPLPPVKVSWQNETRLRFALKGLQPGQIAQMCQLVGLRVLAIKRIRIGRLPLARLQPEQWRYLLGYERF